MNSLWGLIIAFVFVIKIIDVFVFFSKKKKIYREKEESKLSKRVKLFLLFCAFIWVAKNLDDNEKRRQLQTAEENQLEDKKGQEEVFNLTGKVTSGLVEATGMNGIIERMGKGMIENNKKLNEATMKKFLRAQAQAKTKQEAVNRSYK